MPMQLKLSKIAFHQKKLPAIIFNIFSWKFSFWAVASFAAAILPLFSFDYGIIWDEWIQSHYGKLVLKFILSGGHDQSALKFGETMYLYGGLFDALTAGVYGIIFDSIQHVSQYSLLNDFTQPHWHDTRHVINALFGFTAILFTGLSARKIGGWRAGTLALLFMLLSPRFLGNSMNNPKDIPFATAAAIFIYFTIKLLKEIPTPSFKTLLGIAIGIALAINIKVGGILFLCYVWLFTGLIWIYRLKAAPRTFSFLKLSRILIPVSLIGYFGGLLFWPYGLLDPFHHPLQALKAFSNFSGAEGKLLFEGIIYNHGQTPWYYLPKWILISSPLFLISSIFVFFFTSKTLFKKVTPITLVFILFCVFFPLTYAILVKSIVYDGWRHFLFVYPPLVILAALAWNTFFEKADSFLKKSTLQVVLFLLLMEPFCWMVRNHPNETVYFNPLVGGVRGAQSQYETDYWGNCLRQASEGFVDYYKTHSQPQPVVVRSDGELISTAPYLLKGLGSFYVPYAEGKNEWKYSIEMTRGKDSETLKSGAWPGPNAVYVVRADQSPICAVIERNRT